MIDPVICDRHFPYKWRSSVAVFSYEPTEENQTYADLVRQSGHPDNSPVADIIGLDSSIRKKIVKEAPRVSRGRLLRMSPTEQADRFDLSNEEVTKLRKALLGLSGPEPPPKKRWEKSKYLVKIPTDVNVPNIIGMSLDDARKNIISSRLTSGVVTYVDSEKKTGVVLDQCPKSGMQFGPRCKSLFQVAGVRSTTVAAGSVRSTKVAVKDSRI